MALDLWGVEIVVEAPKKKPRRHVQSESYRKRPVYCSENNDIDGWFRENNPKTLAECNEVRKALRKKSQVGNYGADTHHARTGTKLLRVKGPDDRKHCGSEVFQQEASQSRGLSGNAAATIRIRGSEV
jgi:hypothetical protein